MIVFGFIYNPNILLVTKLFTFILFTFLFSSISLAQETDQITDRFEDARIDSLFNDLFYGDDGFFQVPTLKKNYELIYFRTNYDSRTFFAGREIGEQQYNLSSQLYYLHSRGIFLGMSGAWYSQLDPGYRTTVFSLGFSKALKKHKFFRYRLSYDYYLFNSGDVDYDPLYTSGANAGITLKSSSLGTRFNASFLLGKEVGTQLSWDLYGKIKLIKLGTYDNISFDPELSLYFGSEAVEFQLNEVLIDPETNLEYSSYYEDVFGLMNVQIELPLSVVYKSFDIEASWVHNFPQSMDDQIGYLESSFFRFSLGYFFNL